MLPTLKYACKSVNIEIECCFWVTLKEKVTLLVDLA